MAGADLSGRRILVVEDEMLVAMMVEDALTDLGCEILGPIADVEQAREAVRRENLDAALLDLSLHGEPTYPVAETCREQGVPFLFATGYDAEGLAEGFRDAPVLQKPFQDRELAEALSDLLNG